MRIVQVMAVLMAAGVALAASLAEAGLLVYEGFDIPPGEDALNNAAGATSFGWSGNWTGADQDIASPTMAYTDSGGRRLVTAPNRLQIDNTATGPRRDFAGNQFGSSSSAQTVWLSFLASSPSPNNSSWAGLQLQNGSSYQFFIGDTYGGTTWGMQSMINWATADSSVNAGSPALLVVRFDLLNGDRNNAYLWVNPSLDAQPLISGASASLLNFKDVTVNNVVWGMNRVSELDELRIGTTWADVALIVPEPSTLVLLGTAALGGLAWLAWGRRKPQAARSG